MKTCIQLLTRSSLIIATLTLFSSCKVAEKVKEPSTPITTVAAATPTQDAGTTLCSINGKPVINEGDFNKSIAQVLQANPFWRGAGGADALPPAIKRKFLDEMVKQELIVADAQKQNIENDPAFLKELEEMSKLVKRSLMVQFFEKKIFDGIEVTDRDVQKHYNENKDRYVKVAGGALVSSVAFDNEAAADAFKEKAPTNLQEFEKAAKAETGGNFNDYGRVGKESRNEMGVEIAPKALKNAVLAIKNYPAVDKVKIGKQFHVFCAADPKDTEFFDLDEIRPQIEGILKNNLFRDKLDEKLKTLSQSFEVTINEDFFKSKGTGAAEGNEPEESMPSPEALEDEFEAAAAA